MTRANARELALHLIFSRDFTGEEPEKEVKLRLEKTYYEQLAQESEVYAQRPNGRQLAYIDNIVAGVANRGDLLNDYIRQYSIGWDVGRISRVSRCIMQLAMYEILYVEDVPTGVAISEAVRLAKAYDSEEAGAFVNGILGSFARGLTPPTGDEV